MTLVKINKKRTKSSNRAIEHIILKCDECGKKFQCHPQSKTRAKLSKHHFCSRACAGKSHKNGILRKEVKKTNKKKYGNENFAASKIGRKKLNNAMLEKFGAITPFASKEIQNQVKQVFLQKYGRETYAGSEDHKSKLDYKEIAKKSWQTKIKNGGCTKSNPEDKLYDILVAEFGIDNVQRQIYMIRQWVDFYVVPLNLYIQADGIYWHGLNRDIEIIKQGKTRQDVNIYKKMLRDIKLNEHMKNNNMRLLRITDKQINKLSTNELLSIIKGK